MLQRLGQTGGTDRVKGPWKPWARAQAANNHCSLAQSGAGHRLWAGRNHGPLGPGAQHSARDTLAAVINNSVPPSRQCLGFNAPFQVTSARQALYFPLLFSVEPVSSFS